MLHAGLTEQILKAYYKVYNKLGYGFLEKVYEKAMLVELRANGLYCTSQELVKVYYNNVEVGKYLADIIVEDLVIVEIKAAEALCDEHECQLVNYLKATDKEVGLLLNFGKAAQYKRKIYSNDQRKSA